MENNVQNTTQKAKQIIIRTNTQKMLFSNKRKIDSVIFQYGENAYLIKLDGIPSDVYAHHNNGLTAHAHVGTSFGGPWWMRIKDEDLFGNRKYTGQANTFFMFSKGSSPNPESMEHGIEVKADEDNSLVVWPLMGHGSVKCSLRDKDKWAHFELFRNAILPLDMENLNKRDAEEMALHQMMTSLDAEIFIDGHVCVPDAKRAQTEEDKKKKQMEVMAIAWELFEADQTGDKTILSDVRQFLAKRNSPGR